MPTPVGHALMGIAVDQLFCRSERNLLTAIFYSNVPDIDFLPGLVGKDPAAYHAKATHSMPVAVGAGIVSGLLARVSGSRFGQSFIRTSLLYASHLLLDYFGKEAPDGQPLLWPFKNTCYSIGDAWFITIVSRKASDNFFLGLFTPQNYRAVRREVFTVVPALITGLLVGRYVNSIWCKEGFQENVPYRCTRR